MLMKLLKYEWRSTGRVLPLIYLAVLALSVCVGISARNSMVTDMGWANILFISVYMIFVAALAVVTFVVIIERFYRSMISQEGYLMHTLPVKPWQHIVSKAFMAVIWVAIAIVVVVVSFVLIAGVSGVLAEMRNEAVFSIMFNEMRYVFGDDQIDLLITCTVVQGVRLIIQLYLAMAIGGSATKNKVAFSFLAFVVLAIITSIIGTVVSMITVMMDPSGGLASLMMATTTDISSDLQAVFSGAFVSQLIMDGVLLVVFFILTNYFLKKRLNLE